MDHGIESITINGLIENEDCVRITWGVIEQPTWSPFDRLSSRHPQKENEEILLQLEASLMLGLCLVLVILASLDIVALVLRIHAIGCVTSLVPL